MPFDSATYIEPVVTELPEPPRQPTPRENLIRLRNFLAELPDEKFNYKIPFSREIARGVAIHECRTPVCILGWGRALIGEGVHEGEALGITPQQARKLFFQGFGATARFTPTRKDAVATLDHLIRKGKVEWNPTRRFFSRLLGALSTQNG